MLKPIIDNKKCTGCSKCVEICPKNVLVIENNIAVTNENECMLCSHCFSVCAFNAINFNEKDCKSIVFKTLKYKEKLYLPGSGSPVDLINIIRSRRSIRKFKKNPIDDDIISDLIEFAVTAPSGSNYQNWNYTVINGRDKVWNLALKIKEFFEKLNRYAENPIIRYGSIPFTGKALLDYYNDHMDSVKMALEEAEKGIDLLFHGAPGVVIVHSDMTGSTPVEDAQYASYNMTLLAHTMGIGTCYIGYAVEAINRVKELKKYLMIPFNHKVTTVLVLGYPDAVYVKHALRKPYQINWI